MPSGCSMNANIRMIPAQGGQMSGSASETCGMRRAPGARRGRRPGASLRRPGLPERCQVHDLVGVHDGEAVEGLSFDPDVRAFAGCDKGRMFSRPQAAQECDGLALRILCTVRRLRWAKRLLHGVEDIGAEAFVISRFLLSCQDVLVLSRGVEPL